MRQYKDEERAFVFDFIGYYVANNDVTSFDSSLETSVTIIWYIIF